MYRYRVVIVDDEPLMCQELECLLVQYPDVEVAAKCYSGDEAYQCIQKLRPDVVFLDIQMPVMSGLVLAKKIRDANISAMIIFATAYNQFALEAFEVDAVDYILKPYDEEDIQRALNKARRFLLPQRTSSEKKEEKLPQKFSAEKDGKIVIIDRQDIQTVFAKDRLVYIQVLDGNIYVSKLTLQDFETMLGIRFLRCHRNYIVNIDCIQEISQWFNRGLLLKLRGDKQAEVPVSRNYVKDLRKLIQL